MTSTNTQHQNPPTDAPYELIYWPSIPGRGEFIRVAFEASNTSYTDIGNNSEKGTPIPIDAGCDLLNSLVHTETATNPAAFAPPVLRHGSLQLSQTSNILLYLGPRLGLVPDVNSDPNGIYHVNALALTALDGLCNETHDTHHPIAVGDYYEAQKVEAKKRAADYVKSRLPKFLGHFEKVLGGAASGRGEWLYGGRLTYADLVLFQAVDGNLFAFPKAMGSLRKQGKYEKVFALHERVGALESIKKYLKSERRMKYGDGIYRQYPELDL